MHALCVVSPSALPPWGEWYVLFSYLEARSILYTWTGPPCVCLKGPFYVQCMSSHGKYGKTSSGHHQAHAQMGVSERRWIYWYASAEGDGRVYKLSTGFVDLELAFSPWVGPEDCRDSHSYLVARIGGSALTRGLHFRISGTFLRALNLARCSARRGRYFQTASLSGSGSSDHRGKPPIHKSKAAIDRF